MPLLLLVVEICAATYCRKCGALDYKTQLYQVETLIGAANIKFIGQDSTMLELGHFIPPPIEGAPITR